MNRQCWDGVARGRGFGASTGVEPGTGYRITESLKRAESTEKGGRSGGEERWAQGRANLTRCLSARKPSPSAPATIGWIPAPSPHVSRAWRSPSSVPRPPTAPPSPKPSPPNPTLPRSPGRWMIGIVSIDNPYNMPVSLLYSVAE